jgi:GTP-binding protein Era
MRAGYVSIIGRPNAGKSTLLNRIIGEKIAIVSDKPQTTRTRILGAKNYHGDQFVSKLLTDVTIPVVLVLNKIDLVQKARLLPVIEQLRQWRDFSDIVPVSAATGDGVEELERLLLEKMPEGPPLYPEDYLTDQPQRRLVSETVREKVLHHTRDELPFSTAVVVDQYDEPDRPGGLLKVYCTILVETESQKPIIIGRAGSMIKQIGTEARKELEASLECKVYLDLRVKVKSDWRDDERVLDDLGLPRKR